MTERGSARPLLRAAPEATGKGDTDLGPALAQRLLQLGRRRATTEERLQVRGVVGNRESSPSQARGKRCNLRLIELRAPAREASTCRPPSL